MISWLALSMALAAEPLSITLDAGPPRQITLDGMDTLDPFGSSDPPVTWSTSPQSARRTDFPDAVLGDFVSPDGVLSLALPPGRYSASFLLNRQDWAYNPPLERPFGATVDGKSMLAGKTPTKQDFFASDWYATNPRPTFREQQSGWHRQLAQNGHWYTITFDATLKSTSLQIFGGNVHALVVAPANQLAETEAALELLDSKRGKWFETYKNPQRLDSAPPAATDGPLALAPGRWADGASGYRLEGSSFRRRASPGERVTWLGLIGGTDEAVRWRVEGLDDVTVEVDEVVWLDQRWNNELVPRPSYLVPTTDQIAGGQGLQPMLALSITVPVGAKGRTLRGDLVLERGDETIRTPIEIVVRKLSLYHSPIQVGTFADLRSTVGVIHGRDSEIAWNVFEQDVALLRSRGVRELALRMTSSTPENPRFGSWTSPEDPSIFLEAVRRWQRAGGTTVHWVDPMFEIGSTVFAPYRPTVLPDDPKPLFDTLVRAATSHSDVCLYIYDERAVHQHPNLIERTRRFVEALRSHAGDQPLCLSGAVPHRAEWALADVIDRPMVTHNRRDGQLGVQRIQQQGRDAALYLVPADREHTGLIPWALGANALIHWHYNEHIADPFDEVSPRLPWNMSYLGPDGQTVYSSAKLEVVGEGAIDLDYLATVEQLIDEVSTLGGRKGRKARSALDAARNVLSVAKANQANRQISSHLSGQWHDASLDALRQELGDAAEALAQFSTRQRRADGR
ncbi:MAG: hypothetical protein AB8H79_17795 [Myxococcota bacterium]